MTANSFGSRLVLTTFGESHGVALGAVIDGVPAGLRWRDDILTRELDRRKPGGATVSARAEADRPEVLSGIFDGLTLGTPIAVIVRNQDARSEDYQGLASRAGHADDVWREKFGHSDPRGGGRSSGRETLSRVIGGAVARMILGDGVKIEGFAKQIGPFELRFPASPSQQAEVEKLLLSAKAEGKSYGGVAELRVDGLPKGLGQPVFHKLKADLASALLGVGATSAVEIGEDATEAEGSEFHSRRQDERYGGIRGGISTGERLILRVSFKPTSSVLDFAKRGRHDPCIIPRAIPVLEAMTALVLADHTLWRRTDRKEPSV